MFNFDDFKAGQQCNLEDSELKNIPEYDIIYCPENAPSPTPNSRPNSSSPSPSPSPMSNEEMCNKYRCPYKANDGEHKCLKNQQNNSYVCSIDEEGGCKLPRDIWCGDNKNHFTRQIPDGTDFQSRKINVYNYCDRPIKIISTIPQGNVGAWMARRKDPACSDNGYNGRIGGKGDMSTYAYITTDLNDNRVYSNSTNSTNTGLTCGSSPFVYRTDEIVAGGDSTSFTEKLYPVSTSDAIAGCTVGHHCRPSLNYQAIWSDDNSLTVKQIENYMKMQGKAEFSFGADQNVDDNYDVSAMLIGGCGAHTNPWNNDVGFTDLTNPVSQPCGDGLNIYGTNQTMHKKSDLANVMSGNSTPSSNNHDYQGYKSIINKLNPIQSWRNAQKDGCFIDGVETPSGNQCVKTDPGKDLENSYACGFPLYYNYGGKKYLFVDDDNDRRFYDTSEKNSIDEVINDIFLEHPTMTPINKDNNSELFNEIGNKMRNDLYECTASQSMAQINKLNKGKVGAEILSYVFPNVPGDTQTDFIPFKIKTPENQCNEGSVIDPNDTCNIKGYPYPSPTPVSTINSTPP
jgi:hypothetical protein